MMRTETVFLLGARNHAVDLELASGLVANELEDPFGYDENDIAMVQYHEVCARAVERTISNHGHRSVSPRARNPPPTSASPATK